MVISILGAGFLQSTARPIIAFLWQGQFSGSVDILKVHAWAFIPFCLGVARTQYLTAESKLWANLPSVLLALLVNIVLNFLWIPKWSGEGAAWATLVSYTVAWVVTSFMLPGVRPVAVLKLRSLVQLPRLVAEVVRRVQAKTAPAPIEPPLSPPS